MNWSSSTGMVVVGVATGDGTVRGIVGDEMGEGTVEGAGEIGSEPDDHSGDNGVCTGGAGGGLRCRTRTLSYLKSTVYTILL
ncbi:hypothetical protein Tco_0774199 [Tanacetum coccineum]|uniref:Uncharacterized protein n=1 Tax=Tanacetum coccineum TaxID=301880 RepID=A0ABQ4ZRV7_9ASTR